MARTLYVALIFALLSPSYATAQSMTLAEVIRETLANHPDIPISEIGRSFAQTEQERISGMLDPRVSARIGISDEKSPTTNPFAANQTQIGSFSGTVSKPLADGSTLSGSLNYNRTKLTYPATVPAAFQSTLNPIYSHQIDLTYRYPLLRGHGNPAYHELLSAAQSDESSAKWQVEMLKEGLAGQAIALYFQLAIEQLSLDIATDAIARAKQLLNYQKYRERFGLIETADRLQAEALLATRRMEKSSSEAAVVQARTALNRLMLRRGDKTVMPLVGEEIMPPERLLHFSIDGAIETAKSNRPIFKSLEARLAAAEARLNAAQDQHDMQVDLVGQVGSRALEGAAGKALGQGFTLNDRFVGVSVELSDTFNGQATHAGIRQAELARQQVLLEQIQATESVESELSSTASQLRSGAITLQAARERAAAERKKFNAEMKRYREGRSNTATLIQFEGELRMAELQVALQKTSLQMATHQLMLAQGTLFTHLFTETKKNEESMN